METIPSDAVQHLYQQAHLPACKLGGSDLNQSKISRYKMAAGLLSPPSSFTEFAGYWEEIKMTAITTVANPSDFNYEPLPYPSSSIRLAILHAGYRPSPVKITLKASTFISRPKYKALSYTWGSPDVLKVIKLNGQSFKARKNLYDALVHLRHETEERTLWIDAICIDQSNVHERNQQVSLMSYIYTRAEMVIVWLGSILLGMASSNPFLPELSHVCLQPYWKRVWIVQEIGAATDIEVHWETFYANTGPGVQSKSCPWDKFFEMLLGVAEANVPKRLYSQREKRHGDAFLLQKLMDVCQDSLCVEPRDKVYGFVSNLRTALFSRWPQLCLGANL